MGKSPSARHSCRHLPQRSDSAIDAGVVGEGVATDTQWAFLKREGCDFAQGYLLGRPMAAAALCEALAAP